MADNGKRKTIADLSPDAIALRKRLETLSPGDTVSYADLSALVGSDVQTKRHGALLRARAILQRERSMVFAPIKGEGLKRLSDDEIAMTGYNVVRGIRRASTRGMKRLACVGDFSKLSSEAQLAHNTGMALLGVAHQFTAPKAIERVEAEVKKERVALPSARVLQMFT